MATDLLNSGIGDVGRLKFILECIANNKPLYKTDKIFLKYMSDVLELKIQRLQSTSRITDEIQEKNTRTLISDECLDEYLDKVISRENIKTAEMKQSILPITKKKSFFKRLFLK